MAASHGDCAEWLAGRCLLLHHYIQAGGIQALAPRGTRRSFATRRIAGSSLAAPRSRTARKQAARLRLPPEPRRERAPGRSHPGLRRRRLLVPREKVVESVLQEAGEGDAVTRARLLAAIGVSREKLDDPVGCEAREADRGPAAATLARPLVPRGKAAHLLRHLRTKVRGIGRFRLRKAYRTGPRAPPRRRRLRCADGASSGKSASTGPATSSSRPRAARSTRRWKAASPGAPRGRPSSKDVHRVRGGRILSLCSRTRLRTTVGIPARSK